MVNRIDNSIVHLVLVVPCYNEDQMLHITGSAPPPKLALRPRVQDL